jgi:hypothetical protein
MRGSFRWLIVVGALFVIAAWLAGPGRRAVSARRSIAPAFRSRGWAYVGLTIVALLLLFNGQVRDFTRFLFVALVIALGATWIELTRRQTLLEFPDALTSALFADTRMHISSWWEKWRAEAPASNTTAPTNDLAARLQTLADLHARGELTDEEYSAAKARVLSAE